MRVIIFNHFTMNVKRLFVIASVALLCATTMPDAAAQGYLTDATTSTPVLTRDPARQASTEIDAVVTNPAGVAFMPDGFHVSLGGIYSYRDISDCDAAIPAIKYWTKETRLLPTVQAAWKKNRWSVSASFASEGGFGKRDANGSLLLGQMFGVGEMGSALDELNESMHNLWDTWSTVGEILGGAPELNIQDEDEISFISRKANTHLYNWAIRLGATYKFDDHFSAYVGVKANYVTSKGKGGNMQAVVTRPSTGERWGYADYFAKEIPTIQNADMNEALKGIALESLNENITTGNNIDELTNDYIINIFDVHGWGFAPIIGLDYKVGDFNFGAKYEFASHINAKGVREHFNVPASMSVGASWQIIPRLKVAAGSNVVFATYNNVWGTSKPSRAYDLSVSGTFTFNSKWLVSAGYTYSHEQSVFNDILPVPFDAYSNHRISLGGAYSPIENMQINLGVSIYPHWVERRNTVQTTVNNTYTYTVNGISQIKPLVQVALGINYSF